MLRLDKLEEVKLKPWSFRASHLMPEKTETSCPSASRVHVMDLGSKWGGGDAVSEGL